MWAGYSTGAANADETGVFDRELGYWCNGDTMPPAQGLLPCRMFNFGKPKTAGDWIVHIAGAIVAIFLVWWMLRMFVL